MYSDSFWTSVLLSYRLTFNQKKQNSIALKVKLNQLIWTVTQSSNSVQADTMKAASKNQSILVSEPT